jgi:hypothetical protein
VPCRVALNVDDRLVASRCHEQLLALLRSPHLPHTARPRWPHFATLFASLGVRHVLRDGGVRALRTCVVERAVPAIARIAGRLYVDARATVWCAEALSNVAQLCDVMAAAIAADAAVWRETTTARALTRFVVPLLLDVRIADALPSVLRVVEALCALVDAQAADDELAAAIARELVSSSAHPATLCRLLRLLPQRTLCARIVLCRSTLLALSVLTTGTYYAPDLSDAVDVEDDFALRVDEVVQSARAAALCERVAALRVPTERGLAAAQCARDALARCATREIAPRDDSRRCLRDCNLALSCIYLVGE